MLMALLCSLCFTLEPFNLIDLPGYIIHPRSPPEPRKFSDMVMRLMLVPSARHIVRVSLMPL